MLDAVKIHTFPSHDFNSEACLRNTTVGAEHQSHLLLWFLVLWFLYCGSAPLLRFARLRITVLRTKLKIIPRARFDLFQIESGELELEHVGPLDGPSTIHIVGVVFVIGWKVDEVFRYFSSTRYRENGVIEEIV